MVDGKNFRSGFICLAGRPNVGKSTLMNALVDAEVAITSAKPETTRKAIRGILTTQDAQYIFVDTPGIHRPKTLLGKRLNEMVDEQLTEVDVILFLTPADEKIGKGDRLIINHLKQIASKRIPLIAVVSKIDKVPQKELFEHLLEVQELAEFKEVVPVSAKDNFQDNLNELLDVIKKYLPQSPQLYSDTDITDQNNYEMIGEVVRQSALEMLDDELPHSLACQVVDIDRETGQQVIYCNLYVERDSQKGIILGKQGKRIKEIRKRSQRIIRGMVGDSEAILKLSVKVAKNWQSDTKFLNKMGF
ncbi:MAG: GTPase Era [Candidatus Ancillula sp.]|jgi:GTP-binding protein Era|nr:GTPase Era [Candidatus Ancillula sp.]